MPLTINEAINSEIDRILASSYQIEGCITGGCLLSNNDFSAWETAPDIDVFVYSDMMMVHVCDIAQMDWGYKLGATPDGNVKGEEWKMAQLRRNGVNYKSAITTAKFHRVVDGHVITLNISRRKNQNNLLEVISHFDMTHIMRGIDIPTGHEIDLGGGDWHKMVARPNIFKASPKSIKNKEVGIFEVRRAVRQFDRVVKYWLRGYDTLPVARYYVEIIDAVHELGQLFPDSEASKTMYEENIAELLEVRKQIVQWIENKGEAYDRTA